MKPNPSYFLTLEKQLLDFIPKKDLQGAHYLLVKLAKSNHLTISLLGTNAAFVEHHLSIYQNFSATEATLTAFHYTAKYKQQDKVLIVHSYFDHCGNYLLSQVRSEGKKEGLVKLNQHDVVLLSDIAQYYVENSLKTLMSALFSNTQVLAEERKQMLLSLEEKSRLGLSTKGYLDLLSLTIDKLKSHLHFLIDTSNESAVVDLLHKQFMYLSQKSKQLSHKKDQKITSQLIRSDDSSSSLPASQLTHAPEAVDLINKLKSSLEARLVEIVKLPVVERYEEQRDLYNKLLACLENDAFDEIIIFINKIEQLEEERRKEIIKLSRTGDFGKLKKLLQKQDTFILPFILSNAAYHQHYEIFNYIFPLNKYVNQIFIPPLLDHKGKKVLLISFLAVAFDNDDLVFFKALLNKYKMEPVSEVICLLTLFIKLDKIDFAEAFLAAGANPNGMTSKSELMELIDGKLVKLENDPLEEMNKHKQNPLAFAVASRKKDFVELLLKYHARTNVSGSNGFNAFARAVMSEHAEVNKETILLIAAAGGHDIDERSIHGATGLFYACQYQRIESVGVLLELGANPVAPHVTKFRTKSGDSYIESTINDSPLAKAVSKKNLPIVTLILESKSPFVTYKEIQRALLVAVNMGVDNPCIPILKTQYRRLAHTEALRQYKEENFSQVISLYNQILKYSPTPEEYHSYYYCLGSAHFKRKDYAQAEEALYQSLHRRKKLLATAKIIEQTGLVVLIKKVEEKIKEVLSAKAQEYSATTYPEI